MLRDARLIAELYLEDASTVSTNPSDNAAVSSLTAGYVPTMPNAVAEAGEEKKEKSLPAKHWVKVEKIIKDNVLDMDTLAHEVASLIHTCCQDEEVVAKVMSRINKKHRHWSKK
jgi:hypothetical protein